MFHLDKQVIIRIKHQKVIKTLLVASVAAFYFSIMLRCSRTNKLMYNVVLITEALKNVYSVCLFEISKLCTIISLYGFRSIATERNCTFYKVNCWIAALLFVRTDKSFSRSLTNWHSLLMVRLRARMSCNGNYFLY